MHDPPGPIHLTTTTHSQPSEIPWLYTAFHIGCFTAVYIDLAAVHMNINAFMYVGKVENQIGIYMWLNI